MAIDTPQSIEQKASNEVAWSEVTKVYEGLTTATNVMKHLFSNGRFAYQETPNVRFQRKGMTVGGSYKEGLPYKPNEEVRKEQLDTLVINVSRTLLSRDQFEKLATEQFNATNGEVYSRSCEGQTLSADIALLNNITPYIDQALDEKIDLSMLESRMKSAETMFKTRLIADAHGVRIELYRVATEQHTHDGRVVGKLDNGVSYYRTVVNHQQELKKVA